MLRFEPLTLDAAARIGPYFSYQKGRLCDDTLGVALMWREYFDTAYALHDHTLVFRVKYLDNGIAFTVPLGEHPEVMLQAIEADWDGHAPLTYCNVTDVSLPLFQQRYPTALVGCNRDWADYLYNSADFREFRGKRFHGQRNHVNKFARLYPTHRFVDLDVSDLDRAAAFVKWHAQQYPKESDMGRAETDVVLDVLAHYTQYPLCGGLLLVDDEIVALSIGEVLNDTLYVHIEKANTAFAGAYPAMASAFARRYATGDVAYINREEDVGDEGLRTSKLAYHPVSLLNKYVVTVPAVSR